jgi:hydroxyacylglutathione hydrolase
MQLSDLRIAVIVSAPFQENTYLAYIAGRDDCLVFDPGLEPDEILAWLEREKRTPAAILITHGHSDHIAGNGVLKEQFPDCPIVASHGDAPKLTNPRLNLSAEFGLPLYSPPADVLVGEGDTYSAAGINLLVREIPGHSCGHVVFICRDSRPITVFGGDVLFAGSIGRTDFHDGSFEQLATNIHEKLFTLPDDTRVLPGHGPITTVGVEKRNNPFVGAPAGYRG